MKERNTYLSFNDSGTLVDCTYKFGYAIEREKNMIKLSFKIKNDYDNILKQILENINQKDFFWILDEDEVYYQDDFLFQKSKYNNEEFQKIISKDKYYTVFINLKLYKEEDNKEIKTYQDFLESKCLLLLLITDNIFVEIYVKDLSLKRQIMNNIKKYHFQDVEEIDIKDDFRKILKVSYYQNKKVNEILK